MDSDSECLLNYCPNCESLLDIRNDGDITLKCPTCDYSKPMDQGRHLVHSNKFTNQQSNVDLPYGMIFDSTVKRSAKVRCCNADCPSSDITQWGKEFYARADDGYADSDAPSELKWSKNVRIQPDNMIINFTDPDRISTYVCRVCGSISRPKDHS